MPITSTISHDRQEIHSIATGLVGYADIRDHLLLEQQEHSLSYREFVDGRDTIATFNPAEARHIVNLLRKLSQESPIGRKAILAPSGVAFGLTRMIETLAEDFCEVRAFLDEQEARLWLERK